MQHEEDVIPHQDLVEQVVDEQIAADPDTLTASLQTTDETPTVLIDEPVPDGEAWRIVVELIANRVDTLDQVDGITSGDASIVANIDGNPRVVVDNVSGSFTESSEIGGGSEAAVLTMEDDHLTLTVTGEADVTINWVAKIRILRVAVPVV